MSETPNGNGHPTSAEKAWETARERAREQGKSVRDDEIRCIKSKAMSCWAKLLFWILSKVCWEASPFLHNRRVGSVCITGRQLNLHFNFPTKRLYAQIKRTKDESGEVVATRRVPGAIEELESAGLVWMSQKRIDNIPSNKWPNVFNLTTLVPQSHDQDLSLLERVTVDESSGTNGGATDFFANNGRGSGQPPHNGLGKDQRWSLARTNGGSGQAPLAGVGKDQRGDLASTPVGSTGETNGGSGQGPTGGAANPRTRELASPASGTPTETVRLGSDSLDSKTGGKETPTPPVETNGADKALRAWEASLDGRYPSKLEALLKKFMGQRENLRVNPANLEGVTLKPENVEWLSLCDRRLAELGAKKTLTKAEQDELVDRTKTRKELLADPYSYSGTRLKPEAAAAVALLGRKIKILKEKLEGPAVTTGGAR